jgi:hypothetical protein
MLHASSRRATHDNIDSRRLFRGQQLLPVGDAKNGKQSLI